MRLGWTIVAISLVLLVGCSDIPVPNARPTTGRLPEAAEVPNADETVRGAEDPSIVTLPLGSRLRIKRLAKNEELPSGIVVPSTNLKGVPVTAALQAVLSGTDVSLSWEAGTFEDRLVTVANLSGPLPKVVEKICASAKVFCGHRNGLLELKERETFIIELPTVPTKSTASGAATNTMAETIGELAGEKVQVDQQGGNLLYTTNVEGQEKVAEYLSQLRNGRPLLVMQLYIWEVQLNKDHAAGINWNSFTLPKIGGHFQNLVLSGATGFTSLTSPGVSLGAKLAGKVDADMVLQFLASQGQVQTISNPQLTFVSGANAEFRVGGKQRYISQVGQLTTGTLSGSNSTNTGIGTNTVSTESLDTGLTVNLGGTYESGVISAILELEIQDVVSLNPTTTQGVTINLPETTERMVQTSLRVRPGDNLVLAGLVSSRDINDRDAIPTPFGGVPTFGRDQFRNTELVVLVKPSVVLFADAEEIASKTAKVTAAPAVDAVLIDKDGSRTINMPGVENAPASSSISSAGTPIPLTGPNLTDSSSALQPLPGAPAAISDGAPVDNRLLQRGFSHAFNDMLAPTGTTATYGGRP